MNKDPRKDHLDKVRNIANLCKGHVPGVNDTDEAWTKRRTTINLGHAIKKGLSPQKAKEITNALIETAANTEHAGQIPATRLLLENEGSLKQKIELTAESAGWMEKAGAWFAANGMTEAQFDAFAAHVAEQGDNDGDENHDDSGD